MDDIVDVIRDEATEDMVRLAATSSAEMEERSVFGVMRRRLPWLLLCLVGTLLSGGVLEHFDRLLTAMSSLVLFVPAIMAMGGHSDGQVSGHRSTAAGGSDAGALA